MKEPWCQFCHKVVDGKRVFDYNEHHAILCGIGDGLRPSSSSKAWALHEKDWHYYLVARGITFMLWVILLIEVLK